MIRIFQTSSAKTNAAPEGGSGRKESAASYIFGSKIAEKKNYGRGFSTANLGISNRLAECRPSVKTPPGK